MKLGRNDICYCGSGKKYKKCCLPKYGIWTSKSGREPNWYGLEQIPMITSLIEGMLQDSQEQYDLLLPAKDKPHILDDDIINRSARLFDERQEFIEIYEEQFKRWKTQSPSAEQAQEINRLEKQVTEMENLNDKCIALAKQLKKGTINRILEMDDAEIGLKVMTGELKMPS